MQRRLITVNIHQNAISLFATQIVLPHVFKMSAFLSGIRALSGASHWSVDESIVRLS